MRHVMENAGWKDVKIWIEVCKHSEQTVEQAMETFYGMGHLSVMLFMESLSVEEVERCQRRIKPSSRM